MTHGFRQSTFDGPAATYSAYNCTLIESEFANPLGHCLSSSVECHPSVVSFIVVLLLQCNPSAIFRRIRTIIVNAIQFGLRKGPISHICIKCRERIAPSFANVNASSAIIAVGMCVWIVAPLFHRMPYVIDGAVGKSMFFTVVATVDPIISLETSTTSRITSTQVPLIHYNWYATFANAVPASVSSSARRGRAGGFTDNSQSAEFMANEVDSMGSSVYDAVRHSCSPIRTLCLERPFGAYIPSGCSHFMGRA
jgi:hypothetical protein